MPSLALCVICKNEVSNFPQLLSSIKGCFDEIHVTDTGSTDGTLELLQEYEKANPAETPLFVHHFTWVNDFAAARNYSFSHAKTDYTMWLDLDDVLSNREGFIDWKEHVMNTADLWLATYHYGGLKDDGISPCKFMRERVIKNDSGMKWKFFVHEGIVNETGKALAAHYVTSWDVVHKRTEEDSKKDRSRNLKMFEGRGNLPARMVYYYGKELFENNQALDAFSHLMEAAKATELEEHDRIMCLQYACMCAAQCGQVEKSIAIAHQGLQLAPCRAEFHVVIGDGMVKQQKLNEAIPFFSAARACARQDDKSIYSGAIFSHADSYGPYPSNQLARCFIHTNQIDKAREVLVDTLRFKHPETQMILDELERMSKDTKIRDAVTYEKVDEIVFSCIPAAIKEWDEDTLRTKGLGGSETALIYMARALHDITGLRVRVFNDRAVKVEKDGVSFEPLNTMHAYFREKMPMAHIAWRHNIPLTAAPTYLWCHDLSYVGVENGINYTKILALSRFHKHWLHNLFNIPNDKIAVTRNGIEPSRWDTPKVQKNPNKVIFSSSPDRGLDRAIQVMDSVHKELEGTEIHCFYGFDGMRLMGKHDDVARLEKMIADRPWVKMHGNITQTELTKHFNEAAVWLYPTSFLETYCITAIEALCSGVYPVVRKYGGLADTLKEAADKGMATLVDLDCNDESSRAVYARHVINALTQKKWESVVASPEHFSWHNVAMEWTELMSLPARITQAAKVN